MGSLNLSCAQFARQRTPAMSGFTLLELLVVLMLTAVLSSIAVSNMSALANPAQGAAAQLAGFLKEVRARAISQTVAYKVSATSNRTIITQFAVNCSSATNTLDPSLQLTLPTSSALTTTNWQICFTSRGLASNNITIALQDQFVTRQVEVLLGGGVRLL